MVGEKNWLFSRYSTGWKCGLHPDWTELVGCVDAYLQVITHNKSSAGFCEPYLQFRGGCSSWKLLFYLWIVTCNRCTSLLAGFRSRSRHFGPAPVPANWLIDEWIEKNKWRIVQYIGRYLNLFSSTPWAIISTVIIANENQCHIINIPVPTSTICLNSTVAYNMQGVEGDRTPRRYFYISFLRDPVARYLSEFRSVYSFLPAIIIVGAGNSISDVWVIVTIR